MKHIWLKIANFLTKILHCLTRTSLVFLSLQVTIEEDNLLSHPTRDRAKIPLGRRLPTRGHLMAVVGGFQY